MECSEVRSRDVAPTVMEMWMNDTHLMRFFVQGTTYRISWSG